MIEPVINFYTANYSSYYCRNNGLIYSVCFKMWGCSWGIHCLEYLDVGTDIFDFSN
jgi:hypothetical protein